jgi:hypothetical protein
MLRDNYLSLPGCIRSVQTNSSRPTTLLKNFPKSNSQSHVSLLYTPASPSHKKSTHRIRSLEFPNALPRSPSSLPHL